MEQETGTDSVDSLIDEAFDAGRQHVPPERFVDLDKLLREEIDRLVPMVEQLAGSSSVKYRSRQWYACDNALLSADYAKSFRLPDFGPTACALQVAELARRIRELQKVLREVGGVQP